MNQDLVKIARVLKSNGADGEVVIGFRDIDPEEFDFRNPVFIYFDGLPVPFFIESIATRGNSKIVARMTDIETFEDSEEITGQDIYARREDLPEIDVEDDFSVLKGWTLIDASAGKPVRAGIISDFLDIPGNPCIEVSASSGNVTIPLHEDLIVEIDPEKQELTMNIPAGLL